jgi:hypothetical protein
MVLSKAERMEDKDVMSVWKYLIRFENSEEREAGGGSRERMEI